MKTGDQPPTQLPHYFLNYLHKMPESVCTDMTGDGTGHKAN